MHFGEKRGDGAAGAVPRDLRGPPGPQAWVLLLQPGASARPAVPSQPPGDSPARPGPSLSTGRVLLRPLRGVNLQGCARLKDTVFCGNQPKFNSLPQALGLRGTPLGTNHGGLKPGAQACVGPGAAAETPPGPTREAPSAPRRTRVPVEPTHLVAERSPAGPPRPRRPLRPAAPPPPPGSRRRRGGLPEAGLGGARSSRGTQDEPHRGGLRAPPARRGHLPGPDWPGTRHVSLPEPIAAVGLAGAAWLRPRPQRPCARDAGQTPRGGHRLAGLAVAPRLSPLPPRGALVGVRPAAPPPSGRWPRSPSPPPACDASLPGNLPRREWSVSGSRGRCRAGRTGPAGCGRGFAERDERTGLPCPTFTHLSWRWRGVGFRQLRVPAAGERGGRSLDPEPRPGLAAPGDREVAEPGRGGRLWQVAGTGVCAALSECSETSRRTRNSAKRQCGPGQGPGARPGQPARGQLPPRGRARLLLCLKRAPT